MSKRLLLSLVCVLVSAWAWCAVPQTGKYYRIVNANYPEYYMAENYQAGTAVCTTLASKAYQQLWYYTSSGLQNVYTGHYIQPQGSTSQIFKMGAGSAGVNLTSEADGHIKIKCGGNTLHCDASKNVVKWEPEAEASHWSFAEVSLTAEEIAAARKEYQEFEKTENQYASMLDKLQKTNYSALSTFFEDNACTQLKANYKSMSDESLRAAITEAGLPEQLANIAVKIKNGWTDETDASMSAQFRIHDYEAYSAAGPWRWRSVDGNNKVTGLEASQINDMCNPTGVYTTGRDVLFVFVEDNVPAGCELRLSAVSEGVSGFGYNNYDNGTVLKKGINIVGCENDLREYWVMYSVTNKSLKPADMPKVKIHVEGGHVMGYVNVQDKDEASANAEYEKVLKAANKSAEASQADKCRLRLAVKGNYGMFYFQIMCYNRIWSDGSASLLANNPKEVSDFESERWTSNYKQGFKIWKSMRFYDSVLMWEWGLMGFMKNVSEATKENPLYHCYGGEDIYPTYCNNLAYAIMGTAGGNPHSSTGYTHMPGVGAVESSYNAERADFDTWCVGHESGHNNQGLINLESSTESSNNLFSNVITYLYGYRMSRGGTFMDNQAYSYDNVVFSWRDIGMTMRMYYNLYLYYHRAGYKQNFYPTLFSNLRRDPIRLGTTAKTSWLHFYKKACEAAQEDLTEYFRLWGFFIPVDKGEFGDYTSRTVTCTQADIDEAIAWVKSKGWPENKSIMFIEDRLKLVERIDIWAKEGNIRPDNTGTMRDINYLHSQYGELGHFTDYMSGNIHNAGEYSYTVSGQTIEMKGEGGVGILVYDAEGNIIYRSNKLKFNLPAALSTVPFTIKVMNVDGTEVVAVNQTGAEQYREALISAIANAKKIIALSDETGTKVGYYTPEQTASLQKMIDEGQKILDEGTEGSYQSQYAKITGESLRVENEEEVQMVNNTGLYTIQSDRSPNRYMSGDNTLATATTKSAQQQWAFVASSNKGSYYLQNVKSRKLLAANVNSESKIANWTVTTDKLSEASTFTLESAGSGSFYLKTDNVSKGNLYINCDPYGSIAVWSADAGSKWNIVRISEIEEYTDADIKNLVTSTEKLIETVCDYSSQSTKLADVQTGDKAAPYYLSTNATAGTDESHGLSSLLGGSSTYFSTAGATVKAKRFITLDLGEGNETDNMQIYYRTAPGLHTMKPARITVMAGSSTSTLTTVTELTNLPSDATKVETYTSPGITTSTPARIWRFRVEETNGTAATTYPEFALSYLYFYAYNLTITPNAGYEGIDKNLIVSAKTTCAEVEEAVKGETTPLSNYDLFTTLNTVYNQLKDAATATGIDEMAGETMPTRTQTGIYDLSGRRITGKGHSGLYIVNGKKVVIQ